MTVLFRPARSRLSGRSAIAIALLLALFPVASPQVASAAVPIVVSGTVTASDTGLPLENILVNLAGVDSDYAIDATGPDGRYELTGEIPAGSYNLIFVPLPDADPPYVAGWLDSSPSYRGSTQVTLTSGLTTVNETLEPAGYVGALEHGTGYRTTVYRFDSDLGDWRPAGTDAAPFDRIAVGGLGFAAGTYKVGFDRALSEAGPFDGPEFANNTRSPQTSPDVVITPGETSDVDDVQFDPFTFPTATRVEGASRYDVAVNVSRASFPGGAPVVFVATGTNYPDALGAGPIAAKQGGPVLLTTPDVLPVSVRLEIQRLSPSRIVVVGGTLSVRPAVFTELQTLAGDVGRMSGTDRYDAARNLVSDSVDGPIPLLYIATGQTFPDALSAGAAAGHFGVPVLLVNGQADGLDEETRSLVMRLDPAEIRIAGGASSVTSSIASELLALAPTSRLWQSDRYSTSREVGSDAFVTADRVFLATGTNFPDAVAASAWAGAVDAPLFVVPQNCLPIDIKYAIARLGATQITLVGGPSSLTTAVQNLAPCP